MRSEIEFDRDGLVARVAKASVEILRRMGAYVRTVARRKVKTSERPSAAGTPPHSRTGALKRGILFGVEKRQQSVVIGPSEIRRHVYGGSRVRRRVQARTLPEAASHGAVVERICTAPRPDVAGRGEMNTTER